MSGPGLPGRVSGPLRWVLSPLDYRAHVLVDGDRPWEWSRRGAVQCCRWSSLSAMGHRAGRVHRAR
jgi:hypothetical protein